MVFFFLVLVGVVLAAVVEVVVTVVLLLMAPLLGVLAGVLPGLGMGWLAILSARWADWLSIVVSGCAVPYTWMHVPYIYT